MLRSSGSSPSARCWCRSVGISEKTACRCRTTRCSRPAGRQVTSIERAVGVTSDGVEHVLSPELTGGTVEVIHAAQTIVDAIRAGAADELCAEIASRVADSGDDRTAEVVVVRERFDVVAALR